jgi:membrane-bound metal-dependent hydrolase YbcI (DUF457 family)
MMHLFTECSAVTRDSSFYFRHIPRRKDQALSFRPGVIEGNTGWGLHFIEGLNSSLAVTVMFSVSLILGIVFPICWSIWRKGVHGAFGVASYVTSVITLAVMTWQMWAVWTISLKFYWHNSTTYRHSPTKTPDSTAVESWGIRFCLSSSNPFRTGSSNTPTEALDINVRVWATLAVRTQASIQTHQVRSFHIACPLVSPPQFPNTISQDIPIPPQQHKSRQHRQAQDKRNSVRGHIRMCDVNDI